MPSTRVALLLTLLWIMPDAARAQPATEQRPEETAGQGRGGRQGMPPRAGGQADTAPRGTAVIRGVVLAADTGTPIRRAQVRATAPGIRENRLATTDAQGRFEFKELAGGRY